MLQLTGTKAPRSLSVGSVEKLEAGGSCAPIASATHGGDGWVQRASARAQVRMYALGIYVCACVVRVHARADWVGAPPRRRVNAITVSLVQGVTVPRRVRSTVLGFLPYTRCPRSNVRYGGGERARGTRFFFQFNAKK